MKNRELSLNDEERLIMNIAYKYMQEEQKLEESMQDLAMEKSITSRSASLTRNKFCKAGFSIICKLKYYRKRIKKWIIYRTCKSMDWQSKLPKCFRQGLRQGKHRGNRVVFLVAKSLEFDRLVRLEMVMDQSKNHAVLWSGEVWLVVTDVSLNHNFITRMC